MASGRLARRSNSTSSLSKYFHELPDPDHTGSNFCNSSWGTNDRGVEVLFARMRGAARTMEELRAFWKERIRIEEEFAKKLAKLARFSLGRDEIGDFRSALDKLRAETDAQAAQHVNCAQSTKRELETPLDEFIGKQDNHRQTFQAAIEQSYRSKRTQEKYVEKARESYESGACLVDSYTAQCAILHGEELGDIPTKLERAQQTVRTHEMDYSNCARVLGDVCKRWEGEWKTFCDQCQDLEDERLDFIKDHVWAYANTVSTVCVLDDQSCERIRVSLEQADVDRDLENFVKDYGTGSMITEPMPFVPYGQGVRPDGPKQKMAKFLRTSVRGTQSTQPSLSVGPGTPETDVANIGAGNGENDHILNPGVPPPILPAPLPDIAEIGAESDGNNQISSLSDSPPILPSATPSTPTTSTTSELLEDDKQRSPTHGSDVNPQDRTDLQGRLVSKVHPLIDVPGPVELPLANLCTHLSPQRSLTSNDVRIHYNDGIPNQQCAFSKDSEFQHHHFRMNNYFDSPTPPDDCPHHTPPPPEDVPQ
ncbi:hypothetical protein FRC05_001872 [Tulasnella sp. 425]|nr:hypothetical protein FRC05_001872 [Tulasnella sp. 425]